MVRLMITMAALSPQLFEDPEYWSGRGLNQRPPTQQSSGLPTELTVQPNRRGLALGKNKNYGRSVDFF